MNSEAFAVWSSLFDDGVKTAWITECRELKPAAMVLYALKRELRSMCKLFRGNNTKVFMPLVIELEVKFDAKLNSYKQKISSQNCSKIDDNSKCQTLFPIVKHRNSTVDDQSFLESSVLTNTTELSELDQPILETDINNSNNDVTTVSPLKSPKINKNKTVFNKRKKSAQLTPSVLQFNKPNDTKSADIMDGSLNLLRLNTPKRTETIPDFLESSIIENTPLQMNLKKRKKKEASKNQISKNATLTQMFANEAALPIGNTSKQDTSEAGSMNIDEILDFINQCEGEEVEKVCGGKADSNETW